ncbi:type VII secretion target [Streptomyces sp. NBC_01304]|uniref:type VII secretion target n=1 Tax=Streptomyces sp. NBC_01304 TaxID=2903818 RepID=UPI002E13384B|nr:type VII secretion target [Streptomyces sp. NBC_01304]
MSSGPKVDPAELRSSAGACDEIAKTMKEPSDKAVKEADTAGSSLTGWSLGPALTTISTSWKPALQGLHDRAKAGAANLRSSADGHEWNDKRTSQDFENLGGETQTQAAFGTMPAALRPGSPLGPGPGLGSGNDPVARPPGAGPLDPRLDPRTPLITNMPTYDENISTQPAPGGNDFG